MATDYLREYGLRRGPAHGKDDGGLIAFNLFRYVYVVSSHIPTKMCKLFLAALLVVTRCRKRLMMDGVLTASRECAFRLHATEQVIARVWCYLCEFFGRKPVITKPLF